MTKQKKKVAPLATSTSGFSFLLNSLLISVSLDILHLFPVFCFASYTHGVHDYGRQPINPSQQCLFFFPHPMPYNPNHPNGIFYIVIIVERGLSRSCTVYLVSRSPSPLRKLPVLCCLFPVRRGCPIFTECAHLCLYARNHINNKFPFSRQCTNIS